MQPEEPSYDTFVICAANDSSIADLKKRLNKMGSIEVMNGPERGVVLKLQQGKAEPRYAWQAVRDAVGENFGVHPVLIDSEGGPHYPTGRISVRFAHAPDQEEVERFARVHNLETKGKNKFVPSQFVFEPRESANRYLPDILNEIRSEASVKTAWANTLSRYERV